MGVQMRAAVTMKTRPAYSAYQPAKILPEVVIGAFTGHRSGHALNNALLRRLLAERSCWEFVSFERQEDAPSFLQLQLQPQGG